MAPKKSKITVKNVNRSFAGPNRERIDALQNINFEIDDAFSREGSDIGEFRVLLGPSGCGKSTLLRLIAGLDRPDSGELLIGCKQITGPSAERGLVFQDPSLFP